MSRFKVGDRVVILPGHPDPDRVWLVTLVTGVTEFGRLVPDQSPWFGNAREGEPKCMLEGIAPGVCCPTRLLEFYRDDGNERGEWDDLAIRCCKKGKVPA